MRKYMIAGPKTSLPTTDSAWDAARTKKTTISLSEIVEQAIRAVAREKDGAFTDLLTGRTHKECVHERVEVDQTKAAEMVSEMVTKLGFQPISIGHAYKFINSVLARRYKGLSRSQLRKASLTPIEHVGGGDSTA